MTWTKLSGGGSGADPNSHTHNNKSTLDLLGTSGSQLTYNGETVGGSGGSATDQLSSLRWGVIGDSISEYDFSFNLGYTNQQPLYWGLIEQRTGIDTLVYAERNQWMSHANGFLRLLGNMKTAQPTLDVITICGLTNDVYYNDNTYVGNPTDTTQPTLCGGVYRLIIDIWAKYQGVPFGFILTHFHNGATNENDEYNDAVTKVCHRYGVPVLDLRKEGGFNTRVQSQIDYYVPDLLHPNDIGHKVMSYRIEDFLRKLIR